MSKRSFCEDCIKSITCDFLKVSTDIVYNCSSYKQSVADEYTQGIDIDESKLDEGIIKTNKYDRIITGKDGSSSIVDVYDVLQAFDVKCPALQHLIKKALCTGLRGHKDKMTDLKDIRDSSERAIELYKKDKNVK